MNKRTFITSSIAAIAGSAALAPLGRPGLAQESCARAGNPATFVLVHGAWCGAFVYNTVAERLRAKGHRVFVPSLTGLGDRTHLASPEINLTTHVNDILSLIRFEELDDIVLVGHSYGGRVISGVAESAAGSISSIVYLDAFVPGLYEPARREITGDNPGNTLPLPDELADSFNIPATERWKYSPHPLGTLQEQFEFTGAYKSISRKTYVWASLSPNFKSVYDALASDPGWNTVAVESGHMLMFDTPDQVVEILEHAV